jgi:hypothetical protein
MDNRTESVSSISPLTSPTVSISDDSQLPIDEEDIVEISHDENSTELDDITAKTYLALLHLICSLNIDVLGMEKDLAYRSLKKPKVDFSASGDQVGYGASAEVFAGKVVQESESRVVVVKHETSSKRFVSISSRPSDSAWLNVVYKEICILSHPLLKDHNNIIGLVGVNLGG